MIAAGAEGLRTSLAASAPLVALLNGGSASIYRTAAPQGAALSYIVMIHSAGGNTNRTQRQEFDQRWTVKAVATTQGAARQISDLIYTALHNTQPTLTLPWRAMDCQQVAPIEYQEITERANFWHAGGVYRLRADSTTIYTG